MTSLPANHRSRIANYYRAKLEELQYFLKKIVDGCDESLSLFKANEQDNDKTEKPITFHFSAYTNTIQTLKDTSGMLKNEALPWSEIKALRHGVFMKGARNAITHDGNTIISAWADGRYFVPNKILRIEYDKLVVIEPPAVDVRQFCLEFSADFAALLSETLKKIPDDDRLSMSIFDINEIDDVFQKSSFLPDFAKKLFAEDREKIAQAIKETKAAHIEKAIQKADEIVAYCAAKLAETASI